jgi:glutathione-regulated potassium-efflux system ancillary protein KefC
MLRLARIGTLLAFLLVGILVGPYALKVYQLSDIWNFLGQIGIVFLWFSMGLELNMKRMWRMRRHIFGFGAAQVLMVAIMICPILFGLTAWTLLGTVMVCLMLAMSSTGSDLQILADRNELQTSMGRQTFSILLFQDLLSIPLLAMLPVFAGRAINLGSEIIDVGVLSIGLILGVVIVGRFLLNPLMRAVVKLRSKEAFLLAILLNIVLWAMALEFAGLPAAMGAFIAGMLLSETVYRHQVQSEIDPYKTMFLAFFFIALGMGMNIPVLYTNWWIVALGVAGLIIIKFIAIYIVARVRGVLSREAFMIALILSQGGEFALLILQTMKTGGISAVPEASVEVLMTVIVMSIMVTPLLLAAYDRLYKSGRLFSSHKAKKINDLSVEKRPDVLILGFGRVGQTIAKMLTQRNISYVAIDMNIDQVLSGREHHYNVFYGDATRPEILKELGLAPRYTKAVVIAQDNAAMAKRTVRAVRSVYKAAKIFARARTLDEANSMRQEGVHAALPETIESSFMLGEQVMESLGLKRDEIEAMISRMRKDNYAKLTGILSRNK